MKFDWGWGDWKLRWSLSFSAKTQRVEVSPPALEVRGWIPPEGYAQFCKVRAGIGH